MAAVQPVEAKFRQQLARKVSIYIGHSQNIKNGVVRLPVLWNLPGFGVEIDGVGVMRPLAANVLNKPCVPLPVLFAVFAPVEHKLRHGIFDKAAVDTAAFKYILCIAAGLPVRSNGLGVGLFDLLVAMLFPAPGNMLGKGAVPG